MVIKESHASCPHEIIIWLGKHNKQIDKYIIINYSKCYEYAMWVINGKRVGKATSKSMAMGCLSLEEVSYKLKPKKKKRVSSSHEESRKNTVLNNENNILH